MFISRETCIICKDKQLKPFTTMNNFPIKCCNDETNQSINWDLVIGNCEYCGSVQQMNLLDPNILYGGKYPLDTTHSPIWNKHHDDFGDFIKSTLDTDKHILEIGASSQVLVKRLHSLFRKYTIFDFSIETANKLDGIEYIEGNCENYTFDSNIVIIISHVFEHLYDPHNFLTNCKKNNVSDIIISIPTMEDLERVHLTREHTFMYNNNDICYLFSLYGYRLNSTKTVDFSIFYQFQKDNRTNVIERNIVKTRYINSEIYFTKKYTVPERSFLVGAGFWSQVLLYNIINKESIIGVLENDPTKQGRTYYNTNLLIQPFSILKEFDSTTHVLILSNKYWTQEVVQLIQKINDSIKIIYLNN
jgi:2-polyprenyl-3-methyl-5-hydroxy-6-metoxy-1,4-benzoquinol methylase